MSSAINIYTADAVTRLDRGYVNRVGSMFSAIGLNDTRRALADVYRYVASAQSTNTATLTRTSAAPVDTAGGKYVPGGSSRGPYKAGTFAGVVFDGTVRADLAPGVDLTMTNTTPANGWTSDVYVGIMAGLVEAGNASGQQVQWTGAYGLPGLVSVAAGQPGFLAKVLAKNDSAEALADCKVYLRPRLKTVLLAGPALFAVTPYPVDNTPHERVDGSGKTLPVKFTVVSTGAGLASVKMDSGAGPITFAVRNVDTGAVLTSATLAMDGSTKYQITESGSYPENSIFVLATTATTASVENTLIFNIRHVWVANDSAGSPGTWTQNFIYLTQAGQAQGILNPAGTCLFWIKIDVGSLAALDQSPFPCDLLTEYARTGEAGWAL